VDSRLEAPLDRYVREHIFEPLGMDDTDLLRTLAVESRLATGYEMSRRGPKTVEPRQLVTAGAASVYSTPRDMARYVAALLGFALAAGLIYVSRSSFERIKLDAALAGVAVAAGSLFARLLFVTLALWAYKRFFYPGFKPFAFSLAGGFIVLYTVELVRYAGVLKKRPSASARQ
jgi:CubicO group peptidase (beta-lactamase class C family)